MASARARLGKARRGIIKRKKQTGVVTGALGAVGTAVAFGAGQKKKADTAWKEYEAGYKELGGDVADIPKRGGFFKQVGQTLMPGGDKGFFQMPEGEVQIGKGRKYKAYDMEEIRKAGEFLGSDAAAVLSDKTRGEYLQRTAPGVEKIRHHDTTKSYSATQQMPSIPEEQIGGVSDTGFVPTPVSPKHERMMRVRSATPSTESYQQMPSVSEEHIGGVDPLGLQRMRVADSENIPEFNIQQPIDPSYEFSEGGGKPFIKRDIGWGEALYDYQSLFEKMDIFPGTWEDKPGSKLPKSYAEGGDFITNGPQEILVGDNPGGRERVTIKPLSSKNDAEFGRYGDDAMKMIDGQPAHINEEIEGDMSPEDIKKHGYTINPITGKKEYFLGAISTGLAIGTSLYKGYQAMQNRGDADVAREAAGDIQQEQLDFLGDVRGQTVTGAEGSYALGQQESGLGAQISRSQFATGQSNIGMGANMELRRAQAFGDQSYSQSGLATSGTIQQKVGMQTGDVSAKYKSDMAKLFETKELEAQQRNLQMVGSQKQLLETKAQADLAFRSGKMSAEEAYENTLTGLESIPGGSEGYQHPLGRFLEGAIG